jgi:hypothetical protein
VTTTQEAINKVNSAFNRSAVLCNPGCGPFVQHVENGLHEAGRADEPETGYRVRDGYTIESHHALLDSSGLIITTVLGLGSPLLCHLGKLLRKFWHKVCDLSAFTIFLLLLPLLRFDYRHPKMPFSMAVIAKKV